MKPRVMRGVMVGIAVAALATLAWPRITRSTNLGRYDLQVEIGVSPWLIYSRSQEVTPTAGRVRSERTQESWVVNGSAWPVVAALAGLVALVIARSSRAAPGPPNPALQPTGGFAARD